ncbi:MAG: VWA domain-containing protein [Chlorobiales bacterium]|nr:VWA domain-containing protein [Chlorobiales bacterium]
MRFGYPDHLYYLFLLIPLAGALGYFLMARFKAAEVLGEKSLVKRLAFSLSHSKVIWKTILIFLGIGFLLFSYAAPQVGSRLKEVKRKGIEIVIALDVSNSMLAQDVKPSRLEKAKYTISNFVDGLGNDRIGLVVFAGQSFLQCPMTSDKSAIKLFMDIISTNAIPSQGTNFSSAIQASLRAFEGIEAGANAEEKNRVRNKVIIVFSDGEDHEAGIDEVLETVAEQKIRIYTVGVGTSTPTPIPMPDGDFKRDKQGSVVSTSLQENLLRKIAEKTEGEYYRIDVQDTDFGRITEDINKLAKEELASKEFLDYDDKFQIFVGIAVLLLVIETGLSDRKRFVERRKRETIAKEKA